MYSSTTISLWLLIVYISIQLRDSYAPSSATQQHSNYRTPSTSSVSTRSSRRTQMLYPTSSSAESTSNKRSLPMQTIDVGDPYRTSFLPPISSMPTGSGNVSIHNTSTSSLDYGDYRKKTTVESSSLPRHRPYHTSNLSPRKLNATNSGGAKDRSKGIGTLTGDVFGNVKRSVMRGLGLGRE